VGTLIRCEAAAFGYNGQVVVDGISFAVEEGDYLCVAGENGSGKSTVIKGLLRLIAPLEGRVTIDSSLRHGIGYLSQQEAAKKDFPAGVWEIVLSGYVGRLGLRPFFTRNEKEAARTHLARLGIEHLCGACFRELSGGQQRRVLLARALCASERLLVLDEPAAGLDPLVSAELHALLGSLNREMGVTIIMVTHALPAALPSATRILHLKNKLCFFGDTASYRASPAGRTFLGDAD
jgi:zinc transport system ATP-binding protein